MTDYEARLIRDEARREAFDEVEAMLNDVQLYLQCLGIWSYDDQRVLGAEHYAATQDARHALWARVVNYMRGPDWPARQEDH